MLRDELQHAVQTAGGIGHLHGDHTGAAQGEAVFLENGFGFFLVINDEAQDTEIGGISQGKSADVDAGLSRVWSLRQTAARFSRKTESCSAFMAGSSTLWEHRRPRWAFCPCRG